MIIARSPLRITLGGGGTDLPSYYENYEGFLIAAAIDKYVYLTLHKTFVDDLIIKYSRLERVTSIDEIHHPIIREAFKMAEVRPNRLEMTSMADIHAGTGLGSSGSFTTALMKALMTYKKQLISPEALAEAACEIELNRLNEPIGKQDQYIAAFGGLTSFRFKKDGSVQVNPVKISEETRHNLEDNLLLFYTGFSRSASAILKDQDDKSRNNDKEMIENLHFIKELGEKSLVTIESGELEEFASLMDVHWKRKQERSPNMSNPKINDWYNLALKNGALGGKLIGAGGGGFLMFYSNDNVRLRRAMATAGLEEVHFGFDYEGSKVVSN